MHRPGVTGIGRGDDYVDGLLVETFEAALALEIFQMTANGAVLQENFRLSRGDQTALTQPGDAVGLHVSSGKVTLTDLTGQTLQAASGILTQLGLSSNPKPDPSCPQDKGATMVHTQSLVGDVPQGSTVDLTYCSG